MFDFFVKRKKMSPNCSCFGWRKQKTKTKPKINEDKDSEKKDSPGQFLLISFLVFVHFSVS